MEIKEIEKELKRCEKKMMGHLKNNEKDELVAEIKCLFISHMNYIEELHSHDLRKVSSLELLQELKRRIEDGKIDIEHFVPEDDFYAVHGLRIGKQSLDLDMLLFKYRQKKDIERAFHDKDYLLGNDLEDTRKELPRKDGEEL